MAVGAIPGKKPWMTPMTATTPMLRMSVFRTSAGIVGVMVVHASKTRNSR